MIRHTDGLSPKEYTLIRDDQQLLQLCQRLPEQSLLSLDCEFMRRDTFRPVPALLQLAWSTQAQPVAGAAIIDPLNIHNWQPLQARFAASSQRHPVVLHSAGEDLQVLQQLGIHDFCVFDTQLAAALTNGVDNISYSNLVDLELHITVASNARIQRSNWLKRPLSDAQLDYALLDIVYLPPLYQKLSQKLHRLGRDGWHYQECRSLQTQQSDDHEAWRNLKGSNRVRSAIARSRMRILAQWRETTARGIDLPRSRILTDSQLLKTAEQPDQLHDHINHRRIGRATIAVLVQQLAAADAENAPAIKKLNSTQSSRLKLLQQHVTDLAAQLNIPPRLLANKRRLTAWVLDEQVEFGSWQQPLLTPLLAQHAG